MSQQLCSICRGIPEEFWSLAYDLFESRMEVKVKLQPYRIMQKQKMKGCQLCTLLLGSIHIGKLRNPNECLYFWRDYSDPHRAFCLGTKAYLESLGTFYFFRVPKIWCQTQLAMLNENIDNVHLMNTWLQTRNSPNEATLDQAKRFLPTRLLDVLAFQKSNAIRLVLSQNIRTTSPPSYLALSHCWGGNVPVQLKKENLQSWLKSGIPFKVLPKTFRDAVEITKQLGVRYIWIDSMCIIQDSGSDWAQEASLMAEVYGNARCTLAALSSKNSSEGCRINPSVQTSLRSPYIELEVEMYRTNRIRIFSKKPESWIEEFNGQPSRADGETDSPLRTRAWVLQEKELSNCTIYFARGQLLWENGPHKATAQVPWQDIKPETQSETPRLMQENLHRQIVGAQQYPWYELVEDYTSRSLTVATDKLVAFSGLAKRFGGGRKQYCAGIWNTDLPAALLWQVKDYTATRPAYLAPSWSWASLMGSITYDSLRLEPDNDSAQYEHPEDVYPGLKTLRVQNAHIVLADKNKPFAEVQEGKIVLGGVRCIRVECGCGVVRFPDGGQPLTQGKAPMGVFYPDIAGEIAAFRDTYCVALQSESIRSFRRHQLRLKHEGAMVSMVMGIVVARLPQNQGYRRLGLARWIDESLFDSARATTVELV
ncbi:heterokaryon incompatibility protein [Stagonosporopsis vannaccii]|nr:heterokaryon incompatibility protein [Stagonosporopsis vannaccii]